MIEKLKPQGVFDIFNITVKDLDKRNTNMFSHI